MQKTRRELLKNVPAAAMAFYLGGCMHSSAYTTSNSKPKLSLAVIQTNCDSSANYPQRSEKTLEQLARLFNEQGPIDLVLTSENNFDGHTNLSSGHDDRRILVLGRAGDEYTIQPKSDNDVSGKINFVQELAKKYESNIFLGTFYEDPGKPNTHFFNTQLHIDLNGKIAGRKRKWEPAENNFLIQTSSGKTYKALSLICWEAFVDKDIQIKINGEIYYAPQKWVRDGSPYDIMLHPKDSSDETTAGIFQYSQKWWTPRNVEDENTIKDFKREYSLYFKLLKQGAPLLIANRSEMGIFNQDLSAFKNTHKTKDYLVVRA